MGQEVQGCTGVSSQAPQGLLVRQRVLLVQDVQGCTRREKPPEGASLLIRMYSYYRYAQDSWEPISGIPSGAVVPALTAGEFKRLYRFVQGWRGCSDGNGVQGC